MGLFSLRSEACYRVRNNEERQIAALGLLKDWVTAVVGIETASIGALGAFFTAGSIPELGFWSILALTCVIVLFTASLVLGMQVLFSLPASAQRAPLNYLARKEDIYSISTYSRTRIGFFTIWFWLTFIAGVVLFAVFAGLQVWPSIIATQPLAFEAPPACASS